MKMLLVLFAAFVACAPSQHPCVTDYEKAGDCPECTEEEIEARVKKVDETCGYQLLGGGGAQ